MGGGYPKGQLPDGEELPHRCSSGPPATPFGNGGAEGLIGRIEVPAPPG